MQKRSFYKYQGTGNDFIMLDNSGGELILTTNQIIQLCDRKFGIGSDGIILLEKSDEAAFYMNFYNPDGSQSFCGNGSRCAVRFAQHIGLVENTGDFKAIDGIHQFTSDKEQVRIQMREVKTTAQQDGKYFIHTGSPHCIVYVTQLSELDVVAEGRKIRYSDTFKKDGINVNFVEECDGKLYIRTYERGVEDETLSCGTGVTAAALSYNLRHSEINELDVVALGGQLQVSWQRNDDGSYTNIHLSGPAKKVFEGTISI